MYKKLSFLFVIIIFSTSYGCASHKFSKDIELSLKVKGFDSSRAGFKFFDASKGCPRYNDFPGAAAYIGKAKVSNNVTTMYLPANQKIHAFYFIPSDTPVIIAKGGRKEIRRRSAQIILLGGEAELQIFKDDDNEIKWIAEGAIQLEPATNCSQEKK